MIRLTNAVTQTSLHDNALQRTVKRALRRAPGFARGEPGVIVLIAPADYNLNDYETILIEILSRQTADFGEPSGGLLFIRASDTPNKIRASLDKEFQRNQRIVVLAETHHNIPGFVRVAADAIIDLTPISPSDFIASCKAVLDLDVSLKQARRALRFPWELIWAALRPGRTINEALLHLMTLPNDPPAQAYRDVPSLSEMHGYGSAKEWGLQLATDLADWKAGLIPWEDVDKGIVLSGPPGVGKTIFARALAKQCDAALIPGSLAAWQARGHLGDLLKAMRSDFEQARKSAPAILFIDELDSVGDRKTFQHDNSNYSTQVVNGLLECLDGLDGREGVVVVGATNDPTNIDRALLRSGRLDHHVAISLPEAADRVAILSQLTQRSFAEKTVRGLAVATEGMTGADLAKAARAARRIARRGQRAIEVSDIVEALPAVVQLDPNYLRAVAIHETGHTLVGIKLRCGEFTGTYVRRQIASSSTDFECGVACFQMPSIIRRDRQAYLDQISLLLAGIAAEELWLGNIGDGGGGSRGSDLAHATKLATLMETTLGMGPTLRYSDTMDDKDLEDLRRSDARLRSRIDKILKEQFARAKIILGEDEELPKSIIKELTCSGQLTPSRLSELTNQRR